MVYGDIIRYIVVNIHPSNEMLKSKLTRRWMVINHLLTSLDDPISVAYSSIALYYDTLFFTK